MRNLWQMKVKDKEGLAGKNGDQCVIDNKKKRNKFARFFNVQNITTEDNVIGSMFANIF